MHKQYALMQSFWNLIFREILDFLGPKLAKIPYLQLQLEVKQKNLFVRYSYKWYEALETICGYLELLKLHISWDIRFLRSKIYKTDKSSTSTSTSTYEIKKKVIRFMIFSATNNWRLCWASETLYFMRY